nr:E3 ubiquitin-protein ligase RNF12-like [Quercus suber]XP_023887982.1 E3 ubiquitin-protein ligase RNF12-like [Quercus suber]
MDEYSGKRVVDGIVVSRKGSGLALRENANNRDHNAQFCNRIGCNGRPNSARGVQYGCSEKAKPSRPLRSSSSGKEIIGSSSKTSSVISKGRKSVTEPSKKLSSQLETDSSETSSVQDEPEVSELTAPPGKIQKGSEKVESSGVTLMEEGSSSVASDTRSRRNLHQGSGLRNQDNLVASSMSLGSKSTVQATRAGANRYGLRNLRCNSISDVIPSGCSSSESSFSKRKDMVKRRNSEGESSSAARGKKMSGSLLEGRSSNSSPSISISDSRRARNIPSHRDNSVPSVRNKRPVNSHTRARLSNQGNMNSLSPNEPSVAIPQMLQTGISSDMNGPSSSHQLSSEIPSNHALSYSRPGSSSEHLHSIRPASPAEVGITRSLMNRDSIRRYNGIAEVLMALERIEQDEDLTYEQILVLETNLFLNGLYVYDQHRDMRLDIDNMSYEELLALEERMGTVSTALTEETLSECLKRSIYESTAPEDAAAGCIAENDVGKKDDVKCSICQEEYVVGDEVGRLQCEHNFHVDCIEQWLGLKNWCPICKASAAPSPSPTPLSPS